MTVRSAAEERKTKQVHSDKEGEKYQKETQFLTRMLVFVSAAYVITSLPYRLFMVIMDVPALADIYDMTKTYWNLR